MFPVPDAGGNEHQVTIAPTTHEGSCFLRKFDSIMNRSFLRGNKYLLMTSLTGKREKLQFKREKRWVVFFFNSVLVKHMSVSRKSSMLAVSSILIHSLKVCRQLLCTYRCMYLYVPIDTGPLQASTAIILTLFF